MSNTNQQLSRFLVAGLMAVGTDFVSYLILSNFLPIAVAKGSSFILGSIVAFFVNKRWTFEDSSNTGIAMVQFGILYCCTFFANVGVNHITLMWLPGMKLIAFLAATGTSTVLNFLGMKFLVFNSTSTR